MTLIEASDDQPEFLTHPSIEVLWDEEREDGIKVTHLHVPDISDGSPGREFTQARVDMLDNILKEHPEWEAPKIINGRLVKAEMNPVSAELYSSEALQEWRTKLVPTAAALANLYHPDELRLASKKVEDDGSLFGGIEIDGPTHDFFVNGLDAIAIRTRAHIMKMVTEQHATNKSEHWVSLACGAAIPVFEAIDGRDGVKLDLVDLDQDILEVAERLASEQGLIAGEDFTTHRESLLRLITGDEALVDKLGRENADFVDLIGIVEYFQKKAAVPLLKNAYKMVKPGGSLVFANMLSTRPQLDLNQRGIGWPGIFPRSLDEIIDLVEDAELRRDAIVNVYIPEDQIYAVIDIHKKDELENDDVY